MTLRRAGGVSGGSGVVHVAYGALYSGSTPTVQTLTATTPAQKIWASFDSVNRGVSESTDGGNTVGLTVDSGGVYLVNFHSTISNSVNTVVVDYEIRVDDVASNYIMQRRTGNANDVGRGGASALLSLTAGQEVSVYITADKNTDLSSSHAQLIIDRVS